MIILCANTEAEYYALEELHDSMGIITDVPVYFIAKNDKRDFCSEQGCGCVYFPCLNMKESFSSEIEAYIDGNSLYIKTDILSCIVQALSRCEENNKSKDRYGRIPLKESSAYKQDIYQTAYLDRLIAGFKIYFIAYLDSQKIFWQQISPSEKPLICLTHDADSIQGKSLIRYAFWLASAVLSLKKTKLKDALNRIRSYMKLNSDPHFSFQTFYEIEKSCGFKSTFFIMSLPFFLGREGRRYSLRRSDLKEVLLKLSKSGWEIGLHPSRVTHLSNTKLKSEWDRLSGFMGSGMISIGVRNHYLKACFPETWRIQEELGIQYDSSLGWSESPGFRSGTARPFKPFDCELNRRLDLWELPLIVMDGTLNGSTDDMVKTCKDMAEEAFMHNTPFTLLWHMDRISQLEYPEFSDAYLKILKFFRENNCLAFTASEIVKIYKNYFDKMAKYRRRV